MAQLTLDRARQIEAGEGPPPTPQELRELEEFKVRMAPVLKKAMAVFTSTQASQHRRAMAIYKRLSPAEQAQWGPKMPSDLLAHVRATAVPAPASPGEARPAPRRVARTVGSRGDPDEPPPHVTEVPPAALTLLRWSRSLGPMRPSEQRRIRELSDKDLLREVRGLNQVDKAVRGFRGKS